MRSTLRSTADICANGHKWMWNEALGGFPPEEFLARVDPAFDGVRAKLAGRFATSAEIAGTLTPEWAAQLGLRAGIPIPVGACDASRDATGEGRRAGDGAKGGGGEPGGGGRGADGWDDAVHGCRQGEGGGGRGWVTGAAEHVDRLGFHDAGAGSRAWARGSVPASARARRRPGWR